MSNARISFARKRWVPGLLPVACGAWLVCIAGPLLHAGESRPVAASLGATQTVYLEYRELREGVTTWDVPLGIQAAPFKKEPVLGGRKIIRGNLKFGSSADQFLPFIWDKSEGKFYLDLNRNQDFTDDTGGAFSCTAPGRNGDYYQTFTNIHLSFKTRGGTHPMLLDFHWYDYNQPHANASPRSYWAGKVSLQGKDWQLGIVENARATPGQAEQGDLVLRPWAARNSGFQLQDGSLDGFPFCSDLFFNGEAYHLRCAYDEQAGAPRYKVELAPRQPKLGELKFAGQFIKRVVMPGRDFTLVLDNPGPVEKVPVGSYHAAQVLLEKGGVQAKRDVPRYGVSPDIKGTTVTATKPAVLTVGGPLTNTVTVDRRGRALNLGYKLVGVSGEDYQLMGARNQPSFAAYRAGKKIASGKFEFG
jgi:hypothetical protein